MTAWWMARVRTATSHTGLSSDGQGRSADLHRVLCLTVQSQSGVGRSWVTVAGNDEHNRTHELLAEAVQAIQPGSAACAVPPPADPASTMPDVTIADLRPLTWLSPMGYEEEHMTYIVSNSAGGSSTHSRSDSWLLQGQCKSVLGRVPVGSTEATGITHPHYDPDRLLFPPWALSQICLPDLLSGLYGNTPIRYPKADLFDPAWGGGIDLEGSDRRATVFGRHGKHLNTATDRQSRRKSGGTSTGHAGISGRYVRDLILADPGQQCRFPLHAAIVEAAAILAPWTAGRAGLVGVRLCRPETRQHTSVILQLQDPCALLDAGTWCGPFQRGTGPWTSRWLVVPAGQFAIVGQRQHDP